MGLLNGQPIQVMLDSGAAANFLSATVADKMGLSFVAPTKNDIGFAEMPNGSLSECKATKPLSAEDGGSQGKFGL